MNDPLSMFAAQDAKLQLAKDKEEKAKKAINRSASFDHELVNNPFLSMSEAPKTNLSGRKLNSSNKASKRVKSQGRHGRTKTTRNEPVGSQPVVSASSLISQTTERNKNNVAVDVVDPSCVCPRSKSALGLPRNRPKPLGSFNARDSFLPGEQLLIEMKVGDCYFFSAALRCEPGVPPMVAGELMCTTYQLRFFPTESYDFPPKYFDVPLGCIQKLELHSTKNGRKVLICVKCKDLRTLVFGFKCEETRKKALQTLKTMAFPSKVELAFCFFSQLTTESSPDGLPYQYNAVQEYNRLGITSQTSPFVFSTSNNGYRMTPTYPEQLIKPRDFSEASMYFFIIHFNWFFFQNILYLMIFFVIYFSLYMWKCASFRSKGRIPAFSWCFPGQPNNFTIQGPTMWRSSQPKVGLGVVGAGGNRNREDELLLSSVRMSNRKSNKLLIADCRAKAAAYANGLNGGGVESNSNYKNASIKYLGIANIHAMRNSLSKFGSLLQSTPSTSTELSWLKYVFIENEVFTMKISYLTTVFNQKKNIFHNK